jgi:hypothetical protein
MEIYHEQPIELDTTVRSQGWGYTLDRAVIKKLIYSDEMFHGRTTKNNDMFYINF